MLKKNLMCLGTKVIVRKVDHYANYGSSGYMPIWPDIPGVCIGMDVSHAVMMGEILEIVQKPSRKKAHANLSLIKVKTSKGVEGVTYWGLFRIACDMVTANSIPL